MGTHLVNDGDPDTDGAADLLARLVGANVDALANTTNQLMASYMAERDWLRAGLDAALSTHGMAWGGTTRDYEALIERIKSVRHPEPLTERLYRDHAHRVATGQAGAEREPCYPIPAWWGVEQGFA